jgi:hypothetical protein
MSSIIVNNTEKLKENSFEPRFSEVDKSFFLDPPLRTASCNVHYSGSTLYDNERESCSKSIVIGVNPVFEQQLIEDLASC